MSKRVSIELPGVAHDNPIPAASRIGPFLVSSAISAKHPETGKISGDIEEQCDLVFAHVRTLLAQAGGSPENVLKLTVWLKNLADRPAVNKRWLEMFPDPHSRPARHTFAAPDLAGAILVQCELMAIL